MLAVVLHSTIQRRACHVDQRIIWMVSSHFQTVALAKEKLLGFQIHNSTEGNSGRQPDMPSTRLGILLLYVFFLPVSLGNVIVNGTRGAQWLWQCQHNFSEKFKPEDSRIYWQSQKNSDIACVHYYAKGSEDLTYQGQSFKNRTKIFPDQFSFGNFSLLMKPLTLEDDNTSLEVVLPDTTPVKKFCQMTLYVAVPFQEPKIEVNQTEMTATCRTKGGYPKPDIKWSSGDGGTGREPHEVRTDMIPEEDGTYSVSSTANITGLQNVTCSVYNPTSNHIKHSTPPEAPPPDHARTWWILVLAFVLVIVLVLVWYCKRNQNPQTAENQPAHQ